MLTRNQIMAFIPSTDLDRARDFYHGKLGMRVLYQDAFALALVSDRTMIRVTQVGKFTPQAFTIFGWEVANIRRAVEQLKQKGIAPQHYGMPGQDEDGIWAAPTGALVAWFQDADGNNLSLTQFARKDRKPQRPAKPQKSTAKRSAKRKR